MWFKPRHKALILLAIIIIIHIIVFSGPVQSDGATEMALAQSFIDTGRFELNGDEQTHFPPVIPLAIAPFLMAFGFNTIGIHVAQFAYYILSLLVCYYLAKAFVPERAMVITILYSFDPIIFGSMYGGTSEVILSILIMATVLMARKALDNARFILLGALFLALAYLSKASSLFIAVGAMLFGGVFLYALRHRRGIELFPLKGRKYLIGAGAVFFATISLWSIRNALTYGSYETNDYTASAFTTLLSNPLFAAVEVLIYLMAYLLWFFVFGAPLLALIIKALRQERKRGTCPMPNIIKVRSITLLLTFILTIWLFAALTSAALIIYEPDIYTNPFFSPQHIRYFAIADPLILILLYYIAGVLGVISKGAISKGDKAPNYKAKAPAIRVNIAAAIVLIVLTVPFISAQQAFVKEYKDMESVLKEEGIEEVWSDSPYDISYNIPWLKVHPYRALYEVPPGRAVISTVAVDEGARKFWRFTLTPRYQPPGKVNITRTVVYNSGGLYATLEVYWSPLNDSDLNNYNVYWDMVWHERCIDYRYGVGVGPKVHSYNITNLETGHRYYVAVVGVDTHGNLLVTSYTYKVVDV